MGRDMKVKSTKKNKYFKYWIFCGVFLLSSCSYYAHTPIGKYSFVSDLIIQSLELKANNQFVIFDQNNASSLMGTWGRSVDFVYDDLGNKTYDENGNEIHEDQIHLIYLDDNNQNVKTDFYFDSQTRILTETEINSEYGEKRVFVYVA